MKRLSRGSLLKRGSFWFCVGSIFFQFIRDIKSIKILTDKLWFYECNFILSWSSKCFGHSFCRLGRGENKNTNVILNILGFLKLWIHSDTF